MSEESSDKKVTLMKVVTCTGAMVVIISAAIGVHLFNDRTYAKTADLKKVEDACIEDTKAIKNGYATKLEVAQVKAHTQLVEYRVDMKVTTDKFISTQERLWSLQRRIQNDYKVPKGTPANRMPSNVPNGLIRELQHLEQEEMILRMQLDSLMKQK